MPVATMRFMLDPRVLWRPLSDGDTPEQALTNAQNAIASWIEAAIDMNRPIPDPSPQQSTADRPVSWSVPALLIYCRDHRCSHHVEVSADGWADDVRLSDIEPRAALRTDPSRT